MALSGSFHNNVSTGYRLSLEWTATQNIADNTSTVTAKLYWLATSGSYNVVSSTSKQVVININGNKLETTSIVGLGYGGMRLLATHTVIVPHNADGTKSISIAGACTFGLTLNGQSIGYKEAGGAITLNTIPRASTMSSSADMTAGFYKPFTLNVASSSFTHTVNMYVGSTWIKRVEGVKTSGQFLFSIAELGTIFTAMAQQKSTSVRFHVTTYNSGTTVGTSEKSGTISAPTPTSWATQASCNIGDTLTGTITRPSADFTYSVGLCTTDGNTLLAWLVSNGTSSSLSYNTSNIANTLYEKIPNATYYTVVAKVFTYCNSVQVHGSHTFNIRMDVVNSNPTFTNEGVTYRDGNSTISDITGNNQYIVQNKSNLYATVSSSAKATAKNSATISYYIFEIAGKSVQAAYSTSNVEANIGTIDVGTDTSLKITAVDSRGLQTTVTKTVTVVPYFVPKLSVTAARQNNFENATPITVKVACAGVSVGGTNKNSMPTLRFQYRTIGGSYGSWTNFTKSGFPSVTGTYTADLPNDKSYEINVQATDAIGSTVTKIITIGAGKPILFINTDTNSVGINRQTTGSDRLEVGGAAYVNGSITTAAGVTTGTSRVWTDNTSGLNLNNSSIRGAHSVIFRTGSNDENEGIFFLKDGKTAGSTTPGDYHKMAVVGNNLMVGGENAFTIGKANNMLLDVGGIYMNGSQTGYKPSKSLGDCQNGWLFIWSGFDYTTQKVENSQWNYFFLPKEGFAQMYAVESSPLIVMCMRYWGTPVRKWIYTNGIVISGHNSNTGNASPGDQYGFYDSRRLVLRWIYEY